MTGLRRLGSVLFCAWVGAWIARAVFHWVLDVSRAWEVAAVIAAAAIGGVLGLAAAIEQEAELEPAPPRGGRDSAVSAMVLIGGVAVIACAFALRFPWGLAAAVVLGLVAAALTWSSG